MSKIEAEIIAQEVVRAHVSRHHGINVTLSRRTLSRRDLLAGMALQGLIARTSSTDWGDCPAFEQFAEWSVNSADALIAELDKPRTK